MSKTTITATDERVSEIAANVASIEAVPQSVWDAMDYGEDNRAWALHWARLGYDVYAYAAAGDPDQPPRWNLWCHDRRIELGRGRAEGGHDGE